jgi:UDP-2-acetamido-2-deoxy-ribo-hexuluronate aminotransferase
MQFIDLSAQQQKIKQSLDSKIQTVLHHGKYIMGPEVFEIEKRLSAYVGAKHGIGCSSGTDALLLALLAFGIGKGDAVFTSTFTFIATAEVISLIGATPIFVDIDPEDFNIDPKKLNEAISTSKALSLSPKAVIAVDLFGLPADYDSLNSIARENGLLLIADGAQSMGGEYKGRKSGSLAEISCTSFFPAKPLGCYGDGGMCFTDDDELSEIMRSLLLHGKGKHKYDNARIGINGRLDTLQAAILLAKMDIFTEEVILRRQIAERYSELFQENNTNGLVFPVQHNEYKSGWAQYSILAENIQQRSELQKKLKEEGIPTAIYYPKPLHLQTAFNHLNYNVGDFPFSEDCANRIFSLPMHPYLTYDEQKQIIHTLNN